MRRYIWQEIICEKRRKVLLVKRKLTSNVNFPFFDGKIRPLCTETAADSIDNGRFVPSDKYSKPVPIPLLFLRLMFLLGVMFQNSGERSSRTRIWTLCITCGKWLKSNITRSLKFQFKWCSCGFSLSRTPHLFKSSSLFIKMLIYHFLENIFTEKIIFLINLPDHR